GPVDADGSRRRAVRGAGGSGAPAWGWWGPGAGSGAPARAAPRERRGPRRGARRPGGAEDAGRSERAGPTQLAEGAGRHPETIELPREAAGRQMTLRPSGGRTPWPCNVSHSAAEWDRPDHISRDGGRDPHPQLPRDDGLLRGPGGHRGGDRRRG